MVVTNDTIQNSLTTRIAATRWGIGTAAQYLKGLDAAKFGVSAEDWKKELESASKRFTFCHEDFETKGFKDGEAATEGALLTFDGVCTTKAKDRDGDVVESGGLVIDTKMPLLFSHLQQSPVGKHLSLIEQNEHSWSSHWGIAGTELGKDCAILVKFGALRLSIGFQPTEFEPLAIEKDSAGGQYVKGWHIKRAQVFETSLVAIPANAQANIFATYEKEFSGLCTAFSRDLLKHDAVKHWAKSFYDKRPVQVQGASLKDEQVTKDTMGGELVDGMAKCDKCGEMKVDTAGECQACGHQHGKKSLTKDITPTETKGLSQYPRGSYEQVQNDLDRSARKYLKSKGKIEDDYGWTDLYATFTDKAVVCTYKGDGKYDCYSIGYKMVNGVAVFDGEPTEVDIEPAILAKRMSDKIHSKEIVTKEVTVEVVKEVVKEVSFDELRKSFMAKCISNDVDGYKALKEAAALFDAITYSREIVNL